MSTPSDNDYQMMVDAISEGALVLFLGAGANLCARPKGAPWERGQYLPDGSELAAHLASEFRFTSSESRSTCCHIPDLARVSQYAWLTSGSGPLCRELHHVLDFDYPLTPLHKFLANLPSILRKKDYPPYQLIVTTNYDDLLENAFKTAGEPFDLVTYETEEQYAGKFWHCPPEGKKQIIEKPNEYGNLSLEKRPVILKIHGTIDRVNKQQDSFVITEDHYIDYLTQTNVLDMIPSKLLDKLRNNHLLFLGYSLRDWNLRVIFRLMWKTTRLHWKSWAIQLQPQELDTRFWAKRDVDIFDMPLKDFIDELDKRVRAL